MGIINPDKMPKAKVKKRRDNTDFTEDGQVRERRDNTDFTQYAEGGKVNAAGNYTKPSLRKRIVSQVKAAATQGTGAGGGRGGAAGAGTMPLMGPGQQMASSVVGADGNLLLCMPQLLNR